MACCEFPALAVVQARITKPVRYSGFVCPHVVSPACAVAAGDIIQCHISLLVYLHVFTPNSPKQALSSKA